MTPGTNTDMASLDEAKNNYIMSIVYTEDKYGIATCDVTTGDFFYDRGGYGKKAVR